jgi:hypothetical protein
MDHGLTNKEKKERLAALMQWPLLNAGPLGPRNVVCRKKGKRFRVKTLPVNYLFFAAFLAGFLAAGFFAAGFFAAAFFAGFFAAFLVAIVLLLLLSLSDEDHKMSY